jgi:hypothetical protein
MATTRKINITPADTGVLGKSLKPESALKATQLLQEDMEKHHIFFNNEGFHSMLPALPFWIPCSVIPCSDHPPQELAWDTEFSSV